MARIHEEFRVDICSEQEPLYGGFITQEAMDEWYRTAVKRELERSYTELICYLRGQPHEIEPSTVGATLAQLAREMADCEPALLAPEHKREFLERLIIRYNEFEAVEAAVADANTPIME